MSRRPVVLVVDDDPHLREIVCMALRREGIDTTEAGDGLAALRAFETERPDAVVLDVLMPEMDGTEVCRRIRARSDVPVLFLSSKDDEIDKVVGLEIGGDDYVTKPFGARELAARVRAMLRRAGKGAAAPEGSRGIAHGRLRVDPDRFEASWDGTVVPLTRAEFGLLLVLASRPGRVYSREELMDHAYDEPTHVSDRTIDSHVRGIRRKFAELGGDPVDTVHGVGYRVGRCE